MGFEMPVEDLYGGCHSVVEGDESNAERRREEEEEEEEEEEGRSDVKRA